MKPVPPGTITRIPFSPVWSFPEKPPSAWRVPCINRTRGSPLTADGIVVAVARSLLASLALVLALAPAAPAAVPGVDPEELIRRVVKNQKRAEAAFEGSTFDQREVKTSYDGAGRVKDVERRLFYVLSGEAGQEASRELVEVDGRAATPNERQKATEEDEKGRKKRLERRAAAKASAPPRVSGEEEDPFVGNRRLSELIGKFEVEVASEKVIDGRPSYILTFRPRPGKEPAKIGERALASLAGTAVIDAADFQVHSVVAHLIRPLKIAGGLAANVKNATVVYEGRPLIVGGWFPCVVDMRLKGKTILFFRLDTAYRFEFANFRRFRVETQSVLASDPSGSN